MHKVKYVGLQKKKKETDWSIIITILKRGYNALNNKIFWWVK